MEVTDVQCHVVGRGSCCTEAHWAILTAPITAAEIKQSIFSIPNGKSPGPDGFTSQFYKDAWDIIGDEICGAIINFFDTGKLLTQINATNITLIPKLDRPTSVKHFRPISCCNVLYKAISKLMCTRLAAILPDIISRNQGAFVKGRSILENILICQDLIRLYNRGMASPRCMFKLDLQKAYDSIERSFVDQMLQALKFPDKFRQLLMVCITSPTYTLSLNGAQFGFFKGKRGLRQGDLISPLIFCICMEYLTRIMAYATNKWYFRYHPLCKSLKLAHLLFADDLLMFCKGDRKSIILVLRVLSTFSAASGLKVNAAKSEVVFNGVSQDLKQDITNISGFQEGTLPFKYLGIPIQPGRLTRHDCNILLEKITARVRSMGARKLSYAGRLVLINSVFNTLHSYWSSIFLIPKSVIKKIEAICRNYMWSGDNEYHRCPLVAWDKVCCSKKEGGLNIKEAGVWNIATVEKLVNWIYTKADRLWVLWIDHVYMKGADWHTYSPPPDFNWNWRNICRVKDTLRGGYIDGQWIPNSKGYSVGAGYHWLQGPHPPVQWYKTVWDTWNVPKHSFNGWLIMQRGLQTREKLMHLGICTSDKCVLCELVVETHTHLFRSCTYSSRIINGIEQWLHLHLQHQTGYSKLQKSVCKMASMACWYYIWQERNSCRLKLVLTSPAKMITDLKQCIRTRLVQKINPRVPNRDKDWLQHLDIHM